MPTRAPEVTPLLVNAKEAAKMLSIGTRTLWTLTKDGTIPHVRLGYNVRYSPDVLRQIAAGRKVK